MSHESIGFSMTWFHGSLIFHENDNGKDKVTINALHNTWRQPQKTALGSINSINNTLWAVGILIYHISDTNVLASILYNQLFKFLKPDHSMISTVI